MKDQFEFLVKKKVTQDEIQKMKGWIEAINWVLLK